MSHSREIVCRFTCSLVPRFVLELHAMVKTNMFTGVEPVDGEKRFTM
jgi:hypothetical protein